MAVLILSDCDRDQCTLGSIKTIVDVWKLIVIQSTKLSRDNLLQLGRELVKREQKISHSTLERLYSGNGRRTIPFHETVIIHAR
jgi:hypothetical protein